jgi:hypothetical protein
MDSPLFLEAEWADTKKRIAPEAVDQMGRMWFLAGKVVRVPPSHCPPDHPGFCKHIG